MSFASPISVSHASTSSAPQFLTSAAFSRFGSGRYGSAVSGSLRFEAMLLGMSKRQGTKSKW